MIKIENQSLTWLGRPWNNRAWLHPLFGSGAVFAAGQVLHATDFCDGEHPLLRGAVSLVLPAIGGAAGILTTAGERFSDASRAYLAGAGLAAGSWLSASMLATPYSGWVGISAAAGALLAAATYPAARHAQLEWEERLRTRRTRVNVQPTSIALTGEPRDPEAVKWETVFTRAGAPNLTYRERIATRCGFSLRMSLPIDGKITFSTLAARLERLEIGTGLAEGCITIERATTERGRVLARDVWVHFDVEDILTQTLHLPDEHTPLSINEAFPVGKYADGETIYLKLREVAALIVGVRGRGKTNFLNVIIHQLSRCVDVVLWMIDLKGGRAVKPWLRPWLDGQVKRPVLDWVATDRIEAHRMLVGARALIEQRGNASVGGSKIKPTRELPAVIVICDEVAALIGARSGPRSRRDGEGETSNTLANIVTDGIQRGRSEAVDFVLATQRSTVTMIGNGDLKSQCELRAGLGVTNPQDARSIFEGNSVAARMLNKLKDNATRGSVLIQDGNGSRIVPGKSFFMGDDDEQATIYRAAKLHANMPAPLDYHGQKAVDAALRKLSEGATGYLDRWSAERAEHLYGDDVPEIEEELAPVTAPVTVMNSDKPESRFFKPRDYAQPREKNWDAEWEGIVAAFESNTTPEPESATDDESGEVERFERMIQIIASAGRRGSMPGEILATMVSEKTAWRARTSMYPALKRALADGRIVQPAGKKGRYYTPGNES